MPRTTHRMSLRSHRQQAAAVYDSEYNPGRVDMAGSKHNVEQYAVMPIEAPSPRLCPLTCQKDHTWCDKTSAARCCALAPPGAPSSSRSMSRHMAATHSQTLLRGAGSSHVNSPKLSVHSLTPDYRRAFRRLRLIGARSTSPMCASETVCSVEVGEVDIGNVFVKSDSLLEERPFNLRRLRRRSPSPPCLLRTEDEVAVVSPVVEPAQHHEALPAVMLAADPSPAPSQLSSMMPAPSQSRSPVLASQRLFQRLRRAEANGPTQSSVRLEEPTTSSVRSLRRSSRIEALVGPSCNVSEANLLHGGGQPGAPKRKLSCPLSLRRSARLARRSTTCSVLASSAQETTNIDDKDHVAEDDVLDMVILNEDEVVDVDVAGDGNLDHTEQGKMSEMIHVSSSLGSEKGNEVSEAVTGEAAEMGTPFDSQHDQSDVIVASMFDGSTVDFQESSRLALVKAPRSLPARVGSCRRSLRIAGLNGQRQRWLKFGRAKSRSSLSPRGVSSVGPCDELSGANERSKTAATMPKSCRRSLRLSDLGRRTATSLETQKAEARHHGACGTQTRETSSPSPPQVPAQPAKPCPPRRSLRLVFQQKRQLSHVSRSAHCHSSKRLRLHSYLSPDSALEEEVPGDDGEKVMDDEDDDEEDDDDFEDEEELGSESSSQSIRTPECEIACENTARSSELQAALPRRSLRIAGCGVADQKRLAAVTAPPCPEGIATLPEEVCILVARGLQQHEVFRVACTCHMLQATGCSPSLFKYLSLRSVGRSVARSGRLRCLSQEAMVAALEAFLRQPRFRGAVELDLRGTFMGTSKPEASEVLYCASVRCPRVHTIVLGNVEPRAIWSDLGRYLPAPLERSLRTWFRLCSRRALSIEAYGRHYILD
eukprot:TRINITY_DN67573_c0_g1_i1.p1 TRINITY_DN67573_c0_g1~~TRINITY_DN67573_c0_g1_i1.p1  ORF type:complete len:878 (+),score=84.84 TRINITY_DN67573_c0_g1_i1:102-2735(+)